MRETKSHVLAIGPFPPTVTGAAKNTALVCDSLEACGVRVRRLATNRMRVRSGRTAPYYAEKTARSLSNALKILFTVRNGVTESTAYLVPDGGLGILFSLAYARVVVSRYPRLVVHHRSYNHIVNPSRLMGRLLRIAPSKTLHVFLDPGMEQRFKSVYSAQFASVYVPNAATCDVEPVEVGPELPSGPVTVGFLSNLVEDKGFDVVAEAFRELSDELGSDVRFLLAGRPLGKENIERLDALRRNLDDRLDYRGEVFGAAKTEFFRECDIFIFPTRHSQEAQPNVLYEAMAAGALIVSTRWAGVPWLLEGSEHRLVDPGPNTAGDIAAAVKQILEIGSLHSARTRQIEAFHMKKADADTRYQELLTYLAGAANH